jgi:hypothetical protein
MAIISNISTPTLSARVPTLEEKKLKVSRLLKNTAQQQYTQLCQMQKSGIKYLWNNPDGLTPQEVCDAVGTDGALYIMAHGALTSCIISAASASNISPDISLPTNAFTVNPDGTVTVLDSQYTA